MNQFSASQNHKNLGQNPQNPSAQDFAESGGFVLHKYHSGPHLMNFNAMDTWSGIYDMCGMALQSWEGAALFPDLMISKQTDEIKIARAVEDAITAERNRLARELHDSVTQTLFATSLIAEVLPDLWKMDEAKAQLSMDELRQLTRGALAEMRTLLFELRPAALKQVCLADLLKQLSEALMGRDRLPISLDVNGACELPWDVKVEMYRIAQESLNNVVKYARADQVEINVQLDANHVHMEIRDNGIGFDPASIKPTSLGLRIMRERAESIHAELQLTSLLGQGTTVSLDWNR